MGYRGARGYRVERNTMPHGILWPTPTLPDMSGPDRTNTYLFRTTTVERLSTAHLPSSNEFSRQRWFTCRARRWKRSATEALRMCARVRVRACVRVGGCVCVCARASVCICLCMICARIYTVCAGVCADLLAEACAAEARAARHESHRVRVAEPIKSIAASLPGSVRRDPPGAVHSADDDVNKRAIRKKEIGITAGKK